MSQPAVRRGRPPTFDRAAALAAAMEVFWRHGYDGASIAMLTRATGFAPPTLYAAFGSKLGLYREALAAYRARGREPAADRDDGEGGAFQTVERFLRQAADRFSRPAGPKGCMVGSGALQCGADSADAARVTAEARCEGLARFIGRLERARDGGEIPAQTDIAALARFYTAVVQGMSAQAIDGADADSLHAVVDLALSAWPR